MYWNALGWRWDALGSIRAHEQLWDALGLHWDKSGWTCMEVGGYWDALEWH